MSAGAWFSCHIDAEFPIDPDLLCRPSPMPGS